MNSFLLQVCQLLGLVVFIGGTEGPGQLVTKVQRELEVILQKILADGVCRIRRDDESLALVVPEQELFLTKGAELTPAGFRLVEQLGLFLQTVPFTAIRVVGHIDRTIMTRSPSLQLAQQRILSNDRATALVQAKSRATAIAQRLQENGVDTKKLATDWYADIRLILPNETDVNRPYNRRVEIVLEL